MTKQKSKNSRSGILPLLAGAALGAGAVFFANKKNRQEVKKSLKKAEKIGQESKGVIGDVFERARELGEQFRKELVSEVESVKKSVSGSTKRTQKSAKTKVGQASTTAKRGASKIKRSATKKA